MTIPDCTVMEDRKGKRKISDDEEETENPKKKIQKTNFVFGSSSNGGAQRSSSSAHQNQAQASTIPPCGLIPGTTIHQNLENQVQASITDPVMCQQQHLSGEMSTIPTHFNESNPTNDEEQNFMNQMNQILCHKQNLQNQLNQIQNLRNQLNQNQYEQENFRNQMEQIMYQEHNLKNQLYQIEYEQQNLCLEYIRQKRRRYEFIRNTRYNRILSQIPMLSDSELYQGRQLQLLPILPGARPRSHLPGSSSHEPEPSSQEPRATDKERDF